MIALAFFALAQPALAQSPADAAREALLQLPVYDVERVGPLASASPSPSPSSGKLQVGDALTLEVSGLNIPGVEDPSRQLQVAPIAGDDLGKSGFSNPETTALPEGAAPTSLRMTVRLLKAGKLTLPALDLKDATGNAVGRTAPFEVEVQSAIRPDDPKPQTPEDLSPPVSLPFPWIYVALAAVVLLSLIAGIIYALRRWNHRAAVPLPETVAPPRPEHEVALAALAELERRALSGADAKQTYFGISDVLKAYLGRRFDFAAPEMTAGEIREWLVSHRPDIGSDATARTLDLIFARLDRVKFSDHVPESGEPVQVIAEARELITRTRRTPNVATSSDTGPGMGPSISSKSGTPGGAGGAI